MWGLSLRLRDSEGPRTGGYTSRGSRDGQEGRSAKREVGRPKESLAKIGQPDG